jgi:hypothetical protein
MKLLQFTGLVGLLILTACASSQQREANNAANAEYFRNMQKQADLAAAYAKRHPEVLLQRVSPVVALPPPPAPVNNYLAEQQEQQWWQQYNLEQEQQRQYGNLQQQLYNIQSQLQ